MKPETKAAVENVANLADLIQQAREAAKGSINVGRPPGGITAWEYADSAYGTKVSISTAQRDLEGLVMDGKYEVITAIAPTSHGAHKICQQKFYVPKKKAKNAVDRVR